MLSFRLRSADAVQVPLLGRRKDWLRNQGRANAALLLLARALNAEFVAPAGTRDFAQVRGRREGCTFELRVAGERLSLTVRHFHTQRTFALDAPGCALPDLDPPRVQAAIEHTCREFATTH
jgi:hypothetical protein